METITLNPENKASDLEVALGLIYHIDNPCTVDVRGVTHNIRSFYLGEAKRLLPSISDPFIKGVLEDKINQYS